MLPTAKCRHITSDGMSFLGGDGEQAVRRFQHPSATSDKRFSAPSGKNAVSQLGCFLLSEPGCGGATAAMKTFAGGATDTTPSESSGSGACSAGRRTKGSGMRDPRRRQGPHERLPVQ